MARRPMPWQEELFNSLSTGNIESAKTTVQQHNVNVGGKIFFSGVTYDKRLHSAPFYYAQGTVRNALGLVLGLLAFAYVMAGALVCLFFITGDFEFANAPGWLRVPTILVFLPVPAWLAVVFWQRVQASKPDATCMHVAAWAGHPQMVLALRTLYRAPTDAVDAAGRLPRDVARDISTTRALFQELQ